MVTFDLKVVFEKPPENAYLVLLGMNGFNSYEYE